MFATLAPRRVPLSRVAAVLSFLALAWWVMRNLWGDPSGRMLTNQIDDHSLFLFFFAHGEQVVFHGADPFHSTALNAPAGVNMMANTSMLALSIPFAPVTHWFGPGVTVTLLLTLGLAGTASAWYWFLRTRLGVTRAAAWIGGLWGGFAPGWISHASGHVNFVSGYVLPFVVDQVLRLREPGRVRRGGVILGLLVTLQAFINEEMLLLTALSLGLTVLFYAMMRPRDAWSVAPRFVAGGLVAVAVAGVLLAYPLYYQFTGPGHYVGQDFVLDRFATSLGSIVAYPRSGIAGNDQTAQRLSASPMEDTVFWGTGACVMILISVAVLWRSAAARAAALAALILLAASFGRQIRGTAKHGGPPAPFGWLEHVPVFDLVTTPRYALAPTAIVGVLLALAASRAFRSGVRPRLLFSAGLAGALVPLFPMPVSTTDAPPVPAFFADRMWKGYVRDGRSLVTVPLPENTSGRTGMRLAALSNSAYRSPRGYFMGPINPPYDMTGGWWAPRRYFSTMLDGVRASGRVPRITSYERHLIREDLSYWRADVVVLLPDAPHWSQLNQVLTTVLGSASAAGGVAFWDVRSPV